MKGWRLVSVWRVVKVVRGGVSLTMVWLLTMMLFILNTVTRILTRMAPMPRRIKMEIIVLHLLLCLGYFPIRQSWV